MIENLYTPKKITKINYVNGFVRNVFNQKISNVNIYKK